MIKGGRVRGGVAGDSRLNGGVSLARQLVQQQGVSVAADGRDLLRGTGVLPIPPIFRRLDLLQSGVPLLRLHLRKLRAFVCPSAHSTVLLLLLAGVCVNCRLGRGGGRRRSLRSGVDLLFRRRHGGRNLVYCWPDILASNASSSLTACSASLIGGKVSGGRVGSWSDPDSFVSMARKFCALLLPSKFGLVIVKLQG